MNEKKVIVLQVDGTDEDTYAMSDDLNSICSTYFPKYHFVVTNSKIKPISKSEFKKILEDLLERINND